MDQYSTSNYHFCTLNDSNFLKPLPSLSFVQKLIDICHAPMTLFESQQRNRYDRKNHILYINNYKLYATTLKEKYGRTVGSFQKQLKMMGFRKRKIRQHSNEPYLQFQSQPSKVFAKYNSSINLQQFQQKPIGQSSGLFEVQQVKNRKLSLGNVMKERKQQKSGIENEQKQMKYMLVWRTNRIGLIEKQMEDLELALEQEIQKAIRMKEQVQKRRKELDKQMETILLAGLVNEVACFTEIDTNMEGEATAGDKVKQTVKPIWSLQSHVSLTLQKLKKTSNVSQMQAAEMIRKISKCSQSQLQLYRGLIYKQTHVHRSVDEE